MVHISSPPRVVAVPPEEEAAPEEPPAKAEVKRRRLRKVQGEAEVPVPGGLEEFVAEQTPAEEVANAGGKTGVRRLRKAGKGLRGAEAEGGVTRATEDLKPGAASGAAKGVERVGRGKETGGAEKLGTVQPVGVAKDAGIPDDAGRGAGLKGAVQPLKKGVLKKVGKKGGVPVFVARAAAEKMTDSPRLRAEGWAILALSAFPPGADVQKVERKRGAKAEPGSAGSVPVSVKNEGGESKDVRVVAVAPGKKGGRLRKRQGEVAEAVTATVSEAEAGAKLEEPEPEPEPKVEAAPPELPAEEPKPAGEGANKPVEKAGATARGAKKGAAKAGVSPGRPPPRRSSRFEKFDFGAAFQGSPTEFSLPEEWLWEAGGRKGRRMSIRLPTEEGAPDQVIEAQIDEVRVRRARAASIEREIEAAQKEAVAKGHSEFVRGEGGEAEGALEKGKGASAAPAKAGQKGGERTVAEPEARAGHGLEGERPGDKGAVLRASGKGGKKGKGKKQKGGGFQVESSAGLARGAGPGVEAVAGGGGEAPAVPSDDTPAQPPSVAAVVAEEKTGGRSDLLTEPGDVEGGGKEAPRQAPAPDPLELGWADDEAQPFVGAVYTRAGKRKGAKAQAGGSGTAKEEEQIAVTGDGEPGPSVTPGKKRPAKGGRKSGAVEEAASERGGGEGADVGDSRTPTGLAASGLESCTRLVRRVSTRRGGEQSQFLELDMGLPSPEYKRKKGGKGEGGGGKKNDGGEEKQSGGLEEGGTEERGPAATGGERDDSLVGEPPGAEPAVTQEGIGDAYTKETKETREAGVRSESHAAHESSAADTQGQGSQRSEQDTEEQPSGKGSGMAQSGAEDARDMEPGEKGDVLRQPETTGAAVGEKRSGLGEPEVTANLDEGRAEQQRDTGSPEREPPGETGGLGGVEVSADGESEPAIREIGPPTSSGTLRAGPAGEAGGDGQPVNQGRERGDLLEQQGGQVQDVPANEAERKEGGGELPGDEPGPNSRLERG